MALLKRVLTGLAGIFGVDLVELAADSASYDPALAVDRFLDELEETERFEKAEDDVHETLAERTPTDALLERLAWRDPDADEIVQLIHDDELDAVDEGMLVDAVERRELGDRFDTGPLQAVEQIDDDPRTVYLHLLEPSADEGAYADRLDKMYREQYGRSPRGLHVPLTELEELQEVDPSYFTQQAAPWLQEAEQGDEQAPTAGGDA